MKIDTALILCAGFGKRLNPITLDTPKPLLELKNVALLETCINLIENLGIRKIIINTFYVGDQISNFLKNFDFWCPWSALRWYEKKRFFCTTCQKNTWKSPSSHMNTA